MGLGKGLKLFDKPQIYLTEYCPAYICTFFLHKFHKIFLLNINCIKIHHIYGVFSYLSIYNSN